MIKPSSAAILSRLCAAVAAASLFLASACAPVTAVKSDAEQLDPDSAIVAFSVKTDALTEYDEELTPSRILFSGMDNRSAIGRTVKPDDSGVFYVVYQVADAGFAFDEIILGNKPGFRTTLPGPELPLAPGTITYLGRLEVVDFRFELSPDSTTYTPTHVKVAFTDHSAEDLEALRRQFAMFRTNEPKSYVLSAWNNVEFVPLDRLVRGRSMVQDVNESPGMIPVTIPQPPPRPGNN